MRDPLQTEDAESPRNQPKPRRWPFQGLPSRLAAFFDPTAAKVGLRGGFFLAFASLVAAHMPVVVGMGYAPWNLEIVLSIALLAALALATSLLLHRVQPLLYLFVCFWIYWALDAYVPNEFPLTWAPALMAIIPVDLTTDQWNILQNTGVAATIWALLLSRASDNWRAMVIAFSCVWFAGLWFSSDRSLLMPTQGATGESVPALNKVQPAVTRSGFQTADGRLRPVVHFILDEQMSPRSLPDTLPKGISLKGRRDIDQTHPAHDIVNDYVSRGFTYYSHVRSVSGQTQKSLASLMILNKDPADENLDSTSISDFRHAVKHNNYVSDLQNFGYTVNIIQSSFLMICPESNSQQCLKYSFGKPGAISSNIDINVTSRAMILLTEMQRAYTNRKSYHVEAYPFIERVLESLGFKQSYEFVYYSNPVSALNLIASINDQIASIKPGQAYIFHLLMPHFPYMANIDCSIKPYAEWTSPNRHRTKKAPPIAVEKIYSDYWDQSACTHKKIMEIVDQIKQKSDVDPIIFVHGDHGSRINGTYEDLSNPSSDNIDMLETFLAVYIDSETDGGAEYSKLQTLQPLFAHVFNDIKYATKSAAPGHPVALKSVP